MGVTFRFDAVCYYVRDLEKAIGFYERVLGFRLASRDVVARFGLDGVLFELVPSADKSLFDGRGNARLVLAVDDIKAAASELVAKGVAVSPIRKVENGALATFRDLDGNELVLWQYA